MRTTSGTKSCADREEESRAAHHDPRVQLRRLPSMKFRAASDPIRGDGCVTMAAPSTSKRFLDGYYDEDCYFHNPPHLHQGSERPWYFDATARTNTSWSPASTTCVGTERGVRRDPRRSKESHTTFLSGATERHDWNWWLKMRTLTCREAALSGGLHRLDLLGYRGIQAHHYWRRVKKIGIIFGMENTFPALSWSA